MRALKTILLGCATTIALSSAVAQDFLQNPKYGPDEETRKAVVMKMNMMSDAYKMNDLQTASNYAKEIYAKAPQASANIYKIISMYYRKKMEAATTVKEKKTYIDSIMLTQDQYVGAFPERTAEILSIKAADYAKLCPAETSNIIKYFEDAITKAGDEIEPNFLAYYFSVLVEGYKENFVPTDTLLGKFDRLGEILTKNNCEESLMAQKQIEQMLVASGAADAANIKKLYATRLKENPTDVEMHRKVVIYLIRENAKDDFTISVMTDCYKLTQDPNMALQLAVIYESRNQQAQAAEYLRKAVENEKDANRRAGILIRGARIMLDAKRYQDAALFARQALASNPNNAYAHLAYAQACINGIREATAEISEKQKTFCMLYDYLLKTRSLFEKNGADEGTNLNDILGVVDDMLNMCRANFLNNEDAFFHEIKEGDMVDYNCGWLKGRTQAHIKK